jgi:hypothetical protein
MKRLRLLGGICLPITLFLASLAMPLALRAQDLTTTANLSGTVTDSTGAVVAQATVIISGVDNGVVRTVKTDTVGGYNVPLLPPATYNLRVAAKGFQAYEQNGITLRPGQGARQDVALAVGSESREVVVTAQAPLVNTTDANLSAEIESKQVEDLPLNLRNVYGLAVLNSSVQNSTENQTLGEGGTSGKADQDISFMNFGGGFFGTSAYMLDGIWDTDSTWGAVIYVPSVEATANMKIQTNSFTAQSGFSTGNVFQVETKSGSSAFHGDLFEFITNEKVDANKWANNLSGLAKTPFRRNQFGASAGGPLYIPGIYKQRNKTFIFGVYEGLRQSTPDNGTFSVPTEKMHSGDFSEWYVPTAASGITNTNLGTDALGYPVLYHQIYDPYSGIVLTTGQPYTNPITGQPAPQVANCPQVPNSSGVLYTPSTCNYRFPVPNNNLAAAHLLNTVGAALMSYYPKPTTSGYTNNYVAAASAPTTSDEYIIRADHNLTDATRMYFRWAYKYEQKTNSPQYYDSGYGGDDPGGPGNIRPNNRFSTAAGFSHVFNATTAVSANAGFQRWHQAGVDQGYPFDFSTIGLQSFLTKNSSLFPLINTDFSALGPSAGCECIPATNVGSVAADLTKALKKNALSMGFINVVLQNNNGFNPSDTTFNFYAGDTGDLLNVSGATLPNTGSGLAGMLMGNVSSGGGTSNNLGTAPEEKYTGFYIQDDVKLTRTLTVNLGMRWEFQTPWTERHNRLAYFDYGAQNPIGGGATGEEVYVGGNNSRHQNATNFRNFAPRIGFTEQILHNLIVRGGYGIFYPPAQFTGTMASPGYSQSTPIGGMTNNGLTVGTSLSNPFPNGLITPTGNAKGPLTDVGYSASTGVPYVRASPEIQEWSLGVQYAFTPNDVLTASYVGNRGTHLMTTGLSRSNVNPALVVPGNTLSSQYVANPYHGLITSSGCGGYDLSAATIPLGRSLQPYSEYCGVWENEAPVGDSYYNALQADFNHRYHSGLNMLVSYTFSKFLDDTGGSAEWAYVGSNGGDFRNPYNVKMDKSVDGSNIKHSLVVNYSYELPFGKKGKFANHVNGATDAVIGGWQITGITSAKSGFPLHMWNNGIVDPFQGAAYADEVASPKLSSGRSYNKWFNTAAFAPSAEWTYGTASRYQSDLHAPGYVNFDGSIQKVWSLPFEKMKVQARGDFFNVFNHTNLYAPNTNVQGSSEGQITNAADNRQIQGGLKVIW